MSRPDEYHLNRLNKLYYDMVGHDLTFSQVKYLKWIVIRHKLTAEEVETAAVDLLQRVDHERKLTACHAKRVS